MTALVERLKRARERRRRLRYLRRNRCPKGGWHHWVNGSTYVDPLGGYCCRKCEWTGEDPW